MERINSIPPNLDKRLDEKECLMEQPLSVPDTADIASGLTDTIPKVLRRLRADLPPLESLQNEPGGSDIAELRASTGQMSLLRILLEHERCSMQEIARQLAVTPPTATGIVKKLLAHGYIERLRHEGDWRVVSVQITKKGWQAVTLYDQIRRESLQRRLAHLSEPELEQLRDALPALQHLINVVP
jgi:DNA-binding MarR family transcriptional regulator